MNTDNLIKEVILNSDKKAYRNLFDFFYPALCLYAKQFVKDRSIAEDLVQDVFVILWENRGKISIETSAKNYLVVCVKNQCLNYLKREVYKQNYMDAYLFNVSDGSEYYEFHLYEELQNLLNESLAKLPETYRIIFEMSRIDNKTNQEIAKELNIPLRSVERYKAKTIDLLKKDLKDYLPLLLYFHLLG